jgi:hypothetical protein
MVAGADVPLAASATPPLATTAADTVTAVTIPTLFSLMARIVVSLAHVPLLA